MCVLKAREATIMAFKIALVLVFCFHGVTHARPSKRDQTAFSLESIVGMIEMKDEKISQLEKKIQEFKDAAEENKEREAYEDEIAYNAKEKKDATVKHGDAKVETESKEDAVTEEKQAPPAGDSVTEEKQKPPVGDAVIHVDPVPTQQDPNVLREKLSFKKKKDAAAKKNDPKTAKGVKDLVQEDPVPTRRDPLLKNKNEAAKTNDAEAEKSKDSKQSADVIIIDATEQRDSKAESHKYDNLFNEEIHDTEPKVEDAKEDAKKGRGDSKTKAQEESKPFPKLDAKETKEDAKSDDEEESKTFPKLDASSKDAKSDDEEESKPISKLDAKKTKEDVNTISDAPVMKDPENELENISAQKFGAKQEDLKINKKLFQDKRQNAYRDLAMPRQPFGGNYQPMNDNQHLNNRMNNFPLYRNDPYYMDAQSRYQAMQYQLAMQQKINDFYRSQYMRNKNQKDMYYSQ